MAGSKPSAVMIFSFLSVWASQAMTAERLVVRNQDIELVVVNAQVVDSVRAARTFAVDGRIQVILVERSFSARIEKAQSAGSRAEYP